MRTRLLVLAATTASGMGCGPSSKSEGCQDSILVGDLVITEVFADYKAPPGGSGTDEGKEWFEIYNAGDRPINLEGLTLAHSRPDGDKLKRHVVKPVTIGPGQYLTFGNSVPDLLPAYIDYGYSASLGDMYNSDGGKLALRCGDTEIDSAIYDSVSSGTSRQLTSAQPPDYTLNDLQTNWCSGSTTEFEVNNFGTPGMENDCVPVVLGQCSDASGMREAVAPEIGDLIITEVMPNPAATSDTTGEWFEIIAMRDVDLNGLALDRAGDSANPRVLESPTCLRVSAGEHALFARSADTAMNGGLPEAAVRGTFTFSLVDGTSTAPGDVRILYGSTVIDAITWTSTRSGKSHALDPDRYDPVANDEASNFCDGTTAYGAGDLGTPGAVNEQCPLVAPAGMCIENGQVRPIRKPAAGALVITELMINPKVESSVGQEWFEITNTGNAAFDLNELGVDQAATTRPPDIVVSADCKPVAPGGFAVFGRSADPAVNGGMPPGTVDATYGFALSNTSGELQILDGTTVLDGVTWGSVGAAQFDGKSINLDPGSFTTTANDVPAQTLGAVWCLATAPYGDGTNLGTPKATNRACP